MERPSEVHGAPAAASPAFPRAAALAVVVVPALLFAWLLTFAPAVGDGGTRRWSADWIPSLGIELSFLLDGLAWLMGLLITGVGTLVFLYAGAYLRDDPQLGRFLLYLLSFMGAMLGLVLADDVVTLFVFWELTSITSYLLIAFHSETASARKAAQQALFVTGGGGLALLGGLLLLGDEAGTYQLSEMRDLGGALRESDVYLAVLVLVVLGAATKSAQFPFHFWLPGAMAAPSPVSAYLHSATMVKAGVYLLARFQPVLGGTAEWTVILVTLGAITTVLGAFLAVQQFDLKRILAYTTVSALGLLVLLIGLGTHEALGAAAAFLLAHALYKAALFLLAGIIEHGTGSRDVRELGGLLRPMRRSGVVLLLAAGSLAGLLPALAFIGKEAALAAGLDDGSAAGITAVVATTTTGALFVTAALVLVRPLFGPTRAPHTPHDPPLAMFAGPALLAFLAVAFGVVPALVDEPLVAPAASAMAGDGVHPHLALFHGLNLALLLTIVAIALGAVVAWQGRRLRKGAGRISELAGPLRPGTLYERGVMALPGAAMALTRRIQHGYLRHYLFTLLLVALVALGGTILLRDGLPRDVTWSEVGYYEVGALVLIVGGPVLAIATSSKLAAVAALGSVGFGVALIYGFFGAPDLAMTQILVETLTVLLFVLVFYRLPGFETRSSRLARGRDALLCLGVGAVMSLLILAAAASRSSGSVSAYFGQNSVPEAFGRNVVNVILVDFRALDTLGEIVVLGVAAIGVIALLRVGLGSVRR